jgi:hypothetical protein
MRYNKTKKKGGGISDWFSSKRKEVKSVSNSPAIKEKVDKINTYDTTNYKELKDSSEIQNKISTVETISAVGAVGTGAIAVVASTGIGLPIAGLMSIVLLLTNKMGELYRYNLLLQLLMQDATFIMMDCYLLYDFYTAS